MKTVIDVKNFNFAYTNCAVLDNINFNVQKGEIIGLLGENGSGKTTLLDALYGFHGKMECMKLMNNTPSLENEEIKGNVSYIQDTPNLLDYLTAEQYLKFICKIEKIKYKERKNEIMDLILSFGLKNEFNDKLLVNYSFGMKKKIQVISEILLHKKIILIDEPTNGLDIRMIILLKELIKLENKTHNTTILISSHNINFLKDVCNRVLIFYNKELVKDIILIDDTNLEIEYLKATMETRVE